MDELIRQKVLLCKVKDDCVEFCCCFFSEFKAVRIQFENSERINKKHGDTNTSHNITGTLKHCFIQLKTCSNKTSRRVHFQKPTTSLLLNVLNNFCPHECRRGTATLLADGQKYRAERRLRPDPQPGSERASEMMNSKTEWEQVTRCRCEADLLPVHSLETSSSSASNSCEDRQSGPNRRGQRTALCRDPDSERSSIECDGPAGNT